MTQNPTLPGYGLLNFSPKIISAYWYNEDVFDQIDLISETLQNEKVVFIITTAWSLIDRYKTGKLDSVLRHAGRHKVRFPQHDAVFLGNDSIEAGLVQQLGGNSFEFNRNAFLNFQDFRSRTQDEKRSAQIRALYTGRIEPYKRIELLEETKGSALAYFAVNQEYYNKIKEQIAHVNFLNGLPDSETSKPLTQKQVRDACRNSQVGLCLSAIEGAMIASVEYLLTGIPVVSTFSIGGRDVFFDKEFSLICEASPKSVADSVTEILRKNIPPATIRDKTCARIAKYRNSLFFYLCEEYRNVDSDFSNLGERLLLGSIPFQWKQWPAESWIGDQSKLGVPKSLSPVV